MSVGTTLLRGAGRTGDEDTEAVRAAFDAMWLTCRTTWPNVVLDPDRFAAYLGERLTPGPACEALARLRAPELFLCCACAAGDRLAIEALEANYGAHIDAVLSRLGVSTEDVAQLVRQRLLVAEEDDPPRITRYSGAGSLAAWLRVTARRTALNAMRRLDPAEAVQQLGLPDTVDDPELDYLKRRYRDDFRVAFFEAVDALEPRPRTLLRQAFVHGMNSRQLGRMYQVHHATAARWVAAAREHLAAQTRVNLTARLRISEPELESIMLLIRSHLDLSIARALQSTGARLRATALLRDSNE